MTLKEYLKRHGLSQNGFGEKIGAADGTVSRWVTGARLPSLRSLIAIERATGGWVTMTDFVIPSSPAGWGDPPSHEAAE